MIFARRLLLGIGMLVIMEGCASKASVVGPLPVDSGRFQSLECRELAYAHSLYSNRSVDLARAQNRQSETDTIAVAASILSAFLLSPMLIILIKQDYRDELASARGFERALRYAYQLRNCLPQKINRPFRNKF